MDLLPIYPARELPIEGVSSELIFSKMSNNNRKLMEKAALLKYIKEDYVPDNDSESGRVLIMAGAGDIDAMVQPVKDIIELTNSGL